MKIEELEGTYNNFSRQIFDNCSFDLANIWVLGTCKFIIINSSLHCQHTFPNNITNQKNV